MTRRYGKIGNNGVVNGSIATSQVGGHFNVGKDVSMPDDTVVIGDSVRIGEGSNVFEVWTNHLWAQPTAVIRNGKHSAILPVVDPSCVTPPITCGGPDVNLEVNETSAPLPPGSYNTVMVRNGAALQLAPGTFNVCKLLVGRNGSVEAQGAVTLNVRGQVRFGTEASLAPIETAPPVQLNVAGSQVRFGQNAVANAHITAPNALLRFGRSAAFDGSFCVDMLRDDKNITLSCTCPAP
jgi:hypothetical protein